MGLITSIAETAATTAATAAFPPLGWALKALGGIESAITWCFATWTRALITIALVIAAIAAWDIHHLRTELATAQAHDAATQKALIVQQASNARLAASIAQQNAAVAALGTDSAEAVAQGNRADADAVARSTARAAQSARIIVPTGPVQADCRTPDSVMAVKGGL